MDDTLAGHVPSSPFTFYWKAIPGTHTLFMRAFDSAGNMAQSETVKFKISP